MRKFNIDHIFDAIATHIKQISTNDAGFYFNLDKLHRGTSISSFVRTKNLYIRVHDICYSEDVFMIDITIGHQIKLCYIEDTQSIGHRDGELPIDCVSEEEFIQYQFVEDTLDIDFETYKRIMNIYHVYEEYIDGRE